MLGEKGRTLNRLPSSNWFIEIVTFCNDVVSSSSVVTVIPAPSDAKRRRLADKR